MTTGLPVNRLINVQVSLTPAGAQALNLQTLLIVGDSDVLDTQARLRTYAGLTQIGLDFGAGSGEYLAAKDFFAQSPQPTSVMIGRWAKTATAGRLMGAQLTATQQALANFTAINNGAIKLAVDGAAPVTASAINLTAVTTMTGIAAAIDAALGVAAAGCHCTWNGYQFVFKSNTTGAASSVGFLVAPAAGTDLKTVLGATAALGARSVNGIVAETAVAAVTAMDVLPGIFWYGLTFGVPVGDLLDADIIAVAGYIEADGNGPHIFGYTSQAAAVPDPVQTNDLASTLSAAGYTRTFGQWSSTDPYAVCSIFGRILTINYLGSKTTINVMYQPEPGVTPELLTLTQANALDAKRINYSATYANGVAVLENGVCAGPVYIDEITNADWLGNYVQTNLFNLLATVGTKVPQTDDGMHLLLNNVEKSMDQAVTNGYIAPGTWGAGGFGQLATGDYLAKGYYIYAPPLASQAGSDRAARKSVPIQIAAKEAGAINTANVIISVNR